MYVCMRVAASNGQVEIFKLLLAHGADLNGNYVCVCMYVCVCELLLL